MMSDKAADRIHDASRDLSRSKTTPLQPPELPSNSICDKQFMDDVEQLKALRSYMIRQAKIAGVRTLELGDLNLLHFDEKGRLPTYKEWADLEHRSSELYYHLPEQDRRRFLYGQLPRFVIKTAAYLGAIALFSLITAVAAAVFSGFVVFGPISAGGDALADVSQLAYRTVHLTIFSAFLVWAAALGGIGSIAFIGMNALAVQEDATFDITNVKLIGLRVVLGALFAVVITLPFGFTPFYNFIFDLFKFGNATPSEVALKSVLLLLPFALGFSTTLVIMILNQFVDAVQSFFGKRSNSAVPPAPRAGPPPVVQAAAADSTQALREIKTVNQAS
jgi:hypothetical protein